MSYVGHLACGRCGTTVAEDDFVAGCPRCAADGKPANVHPVYELGPDDWSRDENGAGLFSRRRMLPVPADGPVVSLGEGCTPLLPLTATGERYGLGRLHLKDETRNPTWSYKDRLAAVAVTKAVADGADTIVVATTGNHGAAAAAYAAAAGIRCVALTLGSVPLTMKVLMQAYGAEVVALEQPRDRWSLMREAVRAWGWVPVSGCVDPPIGSNPFGVDGYKTIAYELFEDLGTVPDAVVVPTAYADALAGIHRGFTDLVVLGLAGRVPRMVAAEPIGPYAASLADPVGAPAEVAPGRSVAFSIAGNMATHQGVAALLASGGTAVVVADDDEIMAEQLTVAAEEGLYLEASSVLAVLAAGRLKASGHVDPDDLIVAIGSSSGLKDVGATARGLPDVPLVAPTLDALADSVRDAH